VKKFFAVPDDANLVEQPLKNPVWKGEDEPGAFRVIINKKKPGKDGKPGKAVYTGIVYHTDSVSGTFKKC